MRESALVLVQHTPQPVLGQVVAAVEVADPVGAVVGGGQPVGVEEHADRALFRSVTDGGKAVVVIVEIVHEGVRRITGWEA